MKKISILAILCLTLSLLAGCNFLVKTGTLKGNITDSTTGEPVAGVLVAAWNQTVKTDENGNYTMKVKAGQFTMIADKVGYARYSKAVEVQADKENVHNFTMDWNTVSGWVTDAQGGGPIIEANVAWKDRVVKTDASGFFSIKIAPQQTADLIITKDDRAMTRVQNVNAEIVRDTPFEIPMRKAKSPVQSLVAPKVTLEIKGEDGEFTTLTPGMELKGNEIVLKQSSEADGDNYMYLMYAWVGTMQRDNRSVYQNGVDTYEWKLDSTIYPNGPTFIRTLCYDSNENAVLMIVPVVINNVKNDDTVPGNMSLMVVQSYSFGKNLGYYSKDKVTGHTVILPEITLPTGEKVKPNVAAPGAVMYNKLAWAKVTGAESYEVYRSIGDDQHFELIGYSKVTTYDDYSAKLVSNTNIYYKVIPYNSAGKGKGLVRVTYLLPTFNVYLQTPANEATKVGRTPTFVWKNVADGEFPDGTAMFNKIHLWDATDYKIWEKEIVSEISKKDNTKIITEVKYDDVLLPGNTYGWDVAYGWAGYIPYDGADGYSISLSYSGELAFDDKTGDMIGTGSVNGENIFTTVLQ